MDYHFDNCADILHRSSLNLKKNKYAIKQIRKKMVEIITKAVSKSPLKDVVDKLINEKIPVEITQQVKKIFPIQNCIIRKVKTINRPRFDSILYYNNSFSIT